MISAADTGTVRILRTSDELAWLEVLGRVWRHDFYHLPRYHSLAEKRAEGEARLFVYEAGNCVFAVPMLLRPLDGLPGTRGVSEGWRDALSVYGYSGVLASHEQVPETVRHGFQQAFATALQEMRVVSFFSRLHPLIPPRGLLAGLGEARPGGQTISIDLTQPVATQRVGYSASVKTRLNRLRRLGVTCHREAGKRHLRVFKEIYHETMRRVQAQDSYFFEEDYFTGLAECLGEKLQLFLVNDPAGEPICGALFTICDGIVQYHLGGTRDAALQISPMRLAIDEARLWGNEQGAHSLHLGGGLGSATDSLFAFKAGFSERRHEFATWRWITQPGIYDALEKNAGDWNAAHNLEPIHPQFFPAYRSPTRPRVTHEALINRDG